MNDEAPIIKDIDIKESNFGLGDHRTWPRKDRIAWHAWASRITEGPHPIEDCDCNDID